MQIPDNNLFSVYGVGAIIEHVIKGKRFVLIQNRNKEGKQFGLIEIPCGKVRALESASDVLRRRVIEETGLRVTRINGMEEHEIMGKNIQNCQPFYSCQSTEKDFPVSLNFFICAVKGVPKDHTQAADNIRWIAIDELSKMLEDEEGKFFPVVVGALKQYVKERREVYGIYE